MIPGRMLLACSILGSVYMLAAAIVFRVFFANPAPVARRDDAVTLLKPLRGDEPRLAPNLATFLDRIRAAIAATRAGLNEVYLHPATADDFPGHGPGYDHRGELAGLLDPAVRAMIAARGIEAGAFARFAGTAS